MRHGYHLAPDAIVDVVDGCAADAVLRHAAECEACRRQCEDAAAALALARSDALPEPSPLFWDHLSARIGAAIRREEPRAAFRASLWRAWLPVPLLAASLVFAVAAGIWQVARPDLARAGAHAAAAADAVQGPVVTADAGDTWDLVAGLAVDVAAESGDAAALDPAPGSAERAVEQLSRDEQGELVRLLEAELGRRPS